MTLPKFLINQPPQHLQCYACIHLVISMSDILQQLLESTTYLSAKKARSNIFYIYRNWLKESKLWFKSQCTYVYRLTLSPKDCKALLKLFSSNHTVLTDKSGWYTILLWRAFINRPMSNFRPVFLFLLRFAWFFQEVSNSCKTNHPVYFPSYFCFIFEKISVQKTSAFTDFKSQTYKRFLLLLV